MNAAFDVSKTDPTFMVYGKLIFGAAMLIASPILGVLLLNNFQEARASTSWPAAPATITASSVVQESPAGKIRFEPKVYYSFKVDNKEYSSGRIAFHGFGSPFKGDAEKITQAYPAGATVQAYYNPQDPSKSTLRPGASFLNYLFLTLPLILLGAGGIMIFEQSKEIVRRRNGGATNASSPGKKKRRRREEE